MELFSTFGNHSHQGQKGNVLLLILVTIVWCDGNEGSHEDDEIVGSNPRNIHVSIFM